MSRAGDFDELLRSHVQAWDHIWHRCELGSRAGEGRADPQLARLPPSADGVGAQQRSRRWVPARGLHGEAYRGHIFWDELFIFPFLDYRYPELTRALLLYRYRRLPEARWAAREEGLPRAMYPWQSGSNGREESQLVHLNPKSGRWIPDNSRLQHTSDSPSPTTCGSTSRPPATSISRRLRSGDADRDRPFGRACRLRPSERPLPHPGGDGARRVPRRLPGCRTARSRRQRLHQRDGGLDPAQSSGCARSPSRGPQPSTSGPTWGPRGGAGGVGEHRTQDDSPLPRPGDHQPVRWLRAIGGVRLGGIPRALPRHSATGPGTRGRRRHPEPLQGVGKPTF